VRTKAGLYNTLRCASVNQEAYLEPDAQKLDFLIVLILERSSILAKTPIAKIELKKFEHVLYDTAI
jgi:hypothetical protein